MKSRPDTLTQAILELAKRGERAELEALAKALNQAARLCIEIAWAAEPVEEAHSSLVLSSAYLARVSTLRPLAGGIPPASTLV